MPAGKVIDRLAGGHTQQLHRLADVEQRAQVVLPGGRALHERGRPGGPPQPRRFPPCPQGRRARRGWHERPGPRCQWHCSHLQSSRSAHACEEPSRRWRRHGREREVLGALRSTPHRAWVSGGADQVRPQPGSTSQRRRRVRTSSPGRRPGIRTRSRAGFRRGGSSPDAVSRRGPSRQLFQVLFAEQLDAEPPG